MAQEMSEQEIARLCRVYRTVHRMAHDRGYIINKEDLQMDLEYFKERFVRNSTINREELMFQVQKIDNLMDSLLVTFPSDKPVGVKYLKVVCTRMLEQRISRGIIVYQGTLTSAANKAIQSLNQGEKSPYRFSYELDTFSESELLVNITEHQLVPHHIVLTDEEKKMLLKRYRLRETQLPRIQITDPVARYYGLKRGQVVKIMRPSETSGRYVTYRLCY